MMHRVWVILLIMVVFALRARREIIYAFQRAWFKFMSSIDDRFYGLTIL
jgi:hypothetical protein